MSTSVEIVGTHAHHANGLVFIAPDRSVWRTFRRPWWDIASWAWWWLSPGPKKWLVVRRDDVKVRVRAVRLAPDHIMIGQPRRPDTAEE